MRPPQSFWACVPMPSVLLRHNPTLRFHPNRKLRRDKVYLKYSRSRRGSNGRRVRGSCPKWYRPVSARWRKPLGWLGYLNVAARSHIPRRRVFCSGQSPTVRRHPHVRNRRSNVYSDNLRHICWSIGCLGLPLRHS